MIDGSAVWGVGRPAGGCGAGIDRCRLPWEPRRRTHPYPSAGSSRVHGVPRPLILSEDNTMAKALLGYMSNTDPRIVAHLTAENRRLKQRVADLEAHILRLQAENDSWAAAAHDSPLLTLDESMQPA